MRKKKVLLGVVVLMVVALAYVRWTSAIRQPLGFSHAQHVKKAIPCITCHVTPSLEVLPSALECRDCHQDKRFPDEVQWVKVYRVAPDIIFSHTKHASVPCSTCHEKFTSGKRWIYESRFKMSFCMDCHEEMRASNACKTCHLNR